MSEARPRSSNGALLVALLAAGALAIGCTLERSPITSSASTDAGRDAPDAGEPLDAEPDAASDAPDDAGELDASDLDAGDLDAGDLDAGDLDAGDLDAGDLDAGDLDAGPPDAGPPDAGPPDAGPPDAPPPCAPLGSLTCSTRSIFECRAAGTVFVETCALACTEPTPGAARCSTVRPAHLPDASLVGAGSSGLTVAMGHTVTIDTGTGLVMDGSVELRGPGTGAISGLSFESVAQPAGFPALAVLSLTTLDVEAGGTLRATGGRPLVVLASGAVTIAGTIDLGAVGGTAGPGGGAGGGRRGAGGSPGGGASGDVDGILGDNQSGGGGGGHAAAGGSGGSEGGAGGGAGGGAIADVDGTPLVGGGGGGGGADGDSGGPGGGGGGALQITSVVSIDVLATGIIRVPGAGGIEGTDSGGGGGAGGTIFLEAPTLNILGVLAANGGGGGGGDTWTGDGQNGARGRDDSMRAAGGNGEAAGNGGSGGAGGTLTGSGGGGAAAFAGGCGGGGGAAGRVRLGTRDGTWTPSGMVSPMPTVGTLVVE